jgi:hypothetical protein
MRILLTVAALLFVIFEPADAQPTDRFGPINRGLEGAWQMVEAEILSGPNAGTYLGSDIQRSLLLYTRGHYSLAFVAPGEPRSAPSGEPTDAELVAAWGPYASQAGTYDVDGSTIHYTQQVNKDPAATMGEGSSYSRDFTIEGDVLETNGPNANYRYTRVTLPAEPVPCSSRVARRGIRPSSCR